MMKTAASAWIVPVFLLLLVSSNTHGQQVDTKFHITQLKAEREKMIANYGPRHPMVVAIDKEIESHSKVSSATVPPIAPAVSSPKSPTSPSPKTPLRRLSDDELRLTVRRLLERIEILEREVAELKNGPAKFQLLGK